MINITKYLDPQIVAILDVDTRDEAIRALVEQLSKAGKLADKEEFYKAILDREKIVSTGIGMSTAIPHAKLADYDDFFVAVGILRKGLDWNALDGSPVRFIFMIGGPDDKQTEYLQILSSLTQIIKDDQIRKKLLTVNSPEAIIEIFKRT